MRRLAVLSLHTSPLAQPGTGDGGGMNVYVRELSSALARAGVVCDVFTRAWTDDLPATVAIEPGLRVHHIVGRAAHPLPKEALPSVVEEFADGVLKRMRPPTASAGTARRGLPFDAVHANYWLSGMAGHIIKHRLNLPLVSTFHTLDRVKAEASPEEVEADAHHQRAEAEADIIRCSDTVLGVVLGGGGPDLRALPCRSVADPHRGPRRRPRLLRSGRPPPGPTGARPPATDGPLLLFVGRIQPLKGVEVAVRTLAALGRRLPRRPSGHGRRPERTAGRVRGRPGGRSGRRARSGRQGRLRAAPAPRAALDLLPGRRRLPGAQPVRVLRPGGPGGCGLRDPGGGLRRRGSAQPHRPWADRFLGRGPHTPRRSPAWVRQILAEPLLAERLSTGAVLRARRYTWARAAHLLRGIYAELTAGPARRVLVTEPAGAACSVPTSGRRSAARSTPGPSASWPPAGRWWRSTASRVVTRSPVRPAGTCGCRGREGVRHGVADPAPTDPAPRDPVHARSRDQRGGAPGSTS